MHNYKSQTPTKYDQSHQPTTNLLQRLSFPQLLLQSDFPRGHSLKKIIFETTIIVDFQVFFVDFIINTKGLGHFFQGLLDSQHMAWVMIM